MKILANSIKHGVCLTCNQAIYLKPYDRFPKWFHVATRDSKCVQQTTYAQPLVLQIGRQ